MSSQHEPKLSHLGATGEAQMVDVSSKPVTPRTAEASARVTCSARVIDALLAGTLPKGEAIATSRLAGINAAKKTSELIPLCHCLALDWVDVQIERAGDDAVAIRATARTAARTGVEMEALTAVSVAALTLYDMAKAADKNIEIGPIRLEHKSGGASGEFVRSAAPPQG